MKPEMNEAELIASLASTTCPACNRTKRTMNTFCYEDYNSLPYGLKQSLYRRVGHGYAEAFENAMECLDQKKVALAA